MFMVFGVVGQAGAGKDTVADMIVKEYGFKRIALADKLKEDLNGWFLNFREFDMVRQSARDRDPVIRRLQQIYGTEIRRNQDDRYWLKEFAMKALKEAVDGSPGVVVSDVRFPNEVGVIKSEWSGKIIFVERQHQEANVDTEHASERYVKDMKVLADAVIDNSGSFDFLRDQVIHKCRDLFGIR